MLTNWFDGNPERVGVYQVNRGEKIGIWFRNWNGEFWGLCEPTANEAAARSTYKSSIGELPWRGLTSERQYKVAEVLAVEVAKTAKRKVVKLDVKHPDGTVFFRADRNKWVAVMNGKQEAARPTSEACLAYLKKKYSLEGRVV
jgi:hypothetical protein